MNFKKYHVSKNWFDITAATSGKYVRDTDGTLENYADTSATNYIDVSGINTLYPQYFTDATPVRQWAAFYNSSKTFVSGFSGYNRAITVPNDAAYVRLTVDNSYINNFTVSSTELESYEPYSSEVWHDIPHYIHNTSTDTLTTLPAIIYPNDTSVTLEITGNSGGTGDRTANLFDKNNADIYPSTNITTGLSRWTAYDGVGRTVRIPCSANTTYAVSIDSAIEQSVFRGLLINTNTVPTIGNAVTGTIAISSSDDNTAVFTTLSDTKYLVLQISATVFNDAIDSLMMVAGSTPQTYEPYGYRIPVVCGDITTNVYSSTQLGISDSITATVSCTAGENSIDVQTTIVPSEITANYHGWHPVQNVHERENGAWT